MTLKQISTVILAMIKNLENVFSVSYFPDCYLCYISKKKWHVRHAYKLLSVFFFFFSFFEIASVVENMNSNGNTDLKNYQIRLQNVHKILYTFFRLFFKTHVLGQSRCPRSERVKYECAIRRVYSSSLAHRTRALHFRRWKLTLTLTVGTYYNRVSVINAYVT